MNPVQSRVNINAASPAAGRGLPFPVVAVGASAGGLAAFTTLLKSLPVRSGMAFVLIQHLEPKHKSALAALLSKATSMPVVEATNAMPIEPNHVYVIPPNRSMTIRNGSLRLAPRSEASGVRRPIDDFSIALAEEQGRAAIGVVLSGTGSDGTRGLKAIKETGGVTFAQDPKTAQWGAMPTSAITSGSADFVLSPPRIAAELARIGRHPYLANGQEVPESSDFDTICLLLHSSAGVDFRQYKQPTVRRRIARRMALQKIASLSKYAQILEQKPEEARALADDIFIHVTGFFRDPECFRALRKRVLANSKLSKAGDRSIRVWVAGCSTGEEVYSLAMLLLEEWGDQASRDMIQIFGTEIQERSVEHARAGLYTVTAVAGVSAARLKRFFVRTDDGYQIHKRVRDLCVFARHDLAKDPPFSRLDLISCRNVLIYMGPALQKRIVSAFQYALKPGGFLFLGTSESISEYSGAFTAADRKHRIFLRKPSAAAFPEFSFPAEKVRETGAAGVRTAPSGAAADFRTAAEGALLEYYAPPALVVDCDLHIVHFQGDTSPYLAPATGQPSFHVLKMIRPEFALDLRTAIHKVRKEGSAAHKDGILFKHHGRPAVVRLEVRPLTKRDADGQGDLLVVFQESEPPGIPEDGKARSGKQTLARSGKQTVDTRHRLERELASTRGHLHALIAEHETAEEEMKAANEEILTSNEELQSTNEELETAREELQSSNEELITLNQELQDRNTELNVLTHDLQNLLAGVDIPVLVLDSGLRVRRFTPVAGKMFNLIPGDVGRPFSDIASNLDVQDWKELFAEVTGEVRVVERDVTDRGGHQYSMRVRPYQINGNEIVGVLLVLFDVDAIRNLLEDARQARDAAIHAEHRCEAILNSLTAHVAVLDPNGNITTTNDAWNRFALESGSLRLESGANYLEVCRLAGAAGSADAGEAANGIASVLKGHRASFRMEYPYHSTDGRRWFLITASPLKGANGGAVVAHADITDRKQAELAAQTSEATVRALLESSAQSIIAVDESETIVLANGNTETMFGYRREELLGQPVENLLPEALRSRAVATGFDLQGRRKDATAFPVEIGISAIETSAGKLTVAFVMDITERRRREDALHESEERLRLAVESTGLGTFDFDPRTGKRIWSDASKRFFGLPPDAEIDNETLRKELHPDDRDRVEEVVEGAIRAGSPGQYSVEFRTKGSQGGAERWISVLGHALFDQQGRPERLVGIMRDITEKKSLEQFAEAHAKEVQALARALLTAQEDERRRVSRELHDQICQQLASLAIDIGELAAAPESAAGGQGLFRALQARVVRTSEEARHIAYELHPSMLDDLGLVASVKDLCRQFSDRSRDLAVAFTGGALPPAIPREVASCIYRVAQECLQNTVRHAGARRVSVSLATRQAHLQLTVKDDGKGFDLTAAKGAGGLGLIGMEERVLLIDGRLSIVTRPGHGTRILLRVPIPKGTL